MGDKWIVIWVTFHSFTILVLFIAILFGAHLINARMANQMILVHTRIGEIVDRLEDHGNQITDLKLQYAPHKRIEELEAWTRTFCTGAKIEACAILKKVKK